MTDGWIVAGVVVPWWAGTAVLRRASPEGASKALLVGGGWLLGQAMVMAGLYLDLRWRGSAHPRILLLALAVVAFLASWPRRTTTRPGTTDLIRWSPWMVVLAASLAVKLGFCAAAIWDVPVRCDDAISIWFFKAKTIAGLGRLPLDPADPHFVGGSNPHYPVFGPLMAAWLPMLAGEWRERLAGLPWLLTGLNTVLVLIGGLRPWLGIGLAVLVGYLVGSAPLVVIHVLRPGYMDLILAAYLAAGTLWLLSWRSTLQVRHYATGVLLLVVAACLKREGPPLALAALACTALVPPPATNGRGRPSVGILALVTLAGASVVIATVDFTEQAEALANPGWQPGVAAALVRHLFEWSSFHFLGPIVVVLGVAALLRPASPLRATVTALAVALAGIVAAVFLLTPQGRFALNDQTPSRLYLQVLPTLVAMLAIGALGRSNPAWAARPGTGGPSES